MHQKKQSQNSKMFPSSQQRRTSAVFLLFTAAVACFVCAARRWDTSELQAEVKAEGLAALGATERPATKLSRIIHTKLL